MLGKRCCSSVYAITPEQVQSWPLILAFFLWILTMFFRNESMLSTAINNTASQTEYPIKKCALDWASIGAFINAAGGREDNDSKNNKAIYF